MSNPPDASAPLPPPPLTVTFTVTLVIFFILSILSICFFRCFSDNNIRDGHRKPNRPAAKRNNGLDPVVIQAFPTFVYSDVKHLRRETYELECAICLLAFDEDSVLRLLTVCYHVFHQGCIDIWLESHKSCPVCRGNLDLSPEKIQESIDVADDDDKEYKGSKKLNAAVAGLKGQQQIDQLPRWNSTGHSIVKDKLAAYYKYTVRLPDNIVKVRVSKGHTGSCITFGRFSAGSRVALDELPGCSKDNGRIG
ncbi:hypothetical protein SAY86_006424 [Trapa natans]|uniref:RING-type E3 ubiquitin transferase n=1 Tax=Trapa natans TaxID=22666 RepID=A0AAN7LDF1_TRANT|nr:hypothetical protein SAY86_006424 [Trapa natans]